MIAPPTDHIVILRFALVRTFTMSIFSMSEQRGGNDAVVGPWRIDFPRIRLRY